MKLVKFTLLVIFALGAYLLLWPVAIDPVAWQAPKATGYVGPWASNNALADLDLLSLGGHHGPEDFALRDDGVIATATHSGDIMLLATKSNEFKTWVSTGGRPLGIEYDLQGNLLVADAMKGLLSISPNGDISLVTNQVDDADIVYADDVDVAQNGMVYFSDATSKFSASQFGGTLPASLLEIMEHKGNGRLLQYNPNTAETRVLLEGLVFANGVAVSHDQRSVLINETGSYRVLRYWLKGPKAGKVDTLIDNLPGFPDNIARSPSGGYWLGFASPRAKSIDDLSQSPFLRKMIQRLPSFLQPTGKDYGHVIKIAENGEVLMDLQDPSGAYPFTTGVLETVDALYISSLTANAVGRRPL